MKTIMSLIKMILPLLFLINLQNKWILCEKNYVLVTANIHVIYAIQIVGCCFGGVPYCFSLLIGHVFCHHIIFMISILHEVSRFIDRRHFEPIVLGYAKHIHISNWVRSHGYFLTPICLESSWIYATWKNTWQIFFWPVPRPSFSPCNFIWLLELGPFLNWFP